MMGILETILEERRASVAASRRELPASSLARRASPPRPAFPSSPVGAGPRAGRCAFLIAECKRASPSKGLLVPDYRPADLARAYERGGAALLSVLTEPLHFQGSGGHLEEVRAAVELPVLRKDFIVDPWQVRESWAMGSDALLLIAAALEPRLLAELAAAAHELGLSVLLEIRGEEEIEAALAAAPDAIGVNARNLEDFSVDPGLPLRLAAAVAASAPGHPPLVAESGMRVPAEGRAYVKAGFSGLLVGEALSTSPDPEAAARAFVEALRGEARR